MSNIRFNKNFKNFNLMVILLALSLSSCNSWVSPMVTSTSPNQYEVPNQSTEIITTMTSGMNPSATSDSDVTEIIPLQGAVIDGEIIFSCDLEIIRYDFQTNVFQSLISHEYLPMFYDVEWSNDSIYFSKSPEATMEPGTGGMPLGKTEIFNMSADGTVIEQLTFGNYDTFNLDSSLNNDYLTYSIDREGNDFENRYAIMLLNIKNGNEKVIYEEEDDWFLTPIWSPQGDKIAILKGYIQGEGVLAHIYIYDLIQETTTQLILDEEIYYFGGLSWSPDNVSIALGVRENEQNGIAILNTVTGEVERYFAVDDPPEDLIWSPDGKRIAYYTRHIIRENEGPTKLWSLNLETGQTDMLHDAGDTFAHFKYQAVWSPDSNFLAYFLEGEKDFPNLIIQDINTLENVVEEEIPETSYCYNVLDSLWVNLPSE